MEVKLRGTYIVQDRSTIKKIFGYQVNLNSQLLWKLDYKKPCISIKAIDAKIFILDKGKYITDTGTIEDGYVADILDEKDNRLGRIFVYSNSFEDLILINNNDNKKYEDHTGQIYNPYKDSWSWL